LRIGINGFGRIGRCVLRAIYETGLRDQMQVVVINEPSPASTIAYLTRYDSTHGKFPGEVTLDKHTLIVNGDEIALLAHEKHCATDWSAHKVDIVFECSGTYGDRATAAKQLLRGAGRVLFSHPGDATVDATIVCGYNEHTLQQDHRIISCASCTTNGIVPIVECLHQAYGVEHGVITTIHSAMNDQPVIDAYHHTNLRKTRAALHSIIPIDPALGAGIDRVMPHLAGRFSAQALRVPTLNVSAMDLTVYLQKTTTLDAVNKLLAKAASTRPDILGYSEEPLASCDFNHDPRSAIVDASQTRLSGGRLLKVLVWFDNEWGYANRMLDVAKAIAQLPTSTATQ
jgi:D-erythrose 4-phosphate dehydrogenase